MHFSPCPGLDLPLCPFVGSLALGCLCPTPCTLHSLLPQLNGLKHRNLAFLFLRSPISPQPHIDLIQPASVVTAFPCVCNRTSQSFPAEVVWPCAARRASLQRMAERQPGHPMLRWRARSPPLTKPSTKPQASAAEKRRKKPEQAPQASAAPAAAGGARSLAS